jgi:NAD dependent epimerase/dehydratase family enzyme
VVLEGQRVLPKRALEQDFAFQYDTIDSAMRSVMSA